MPFQRWGKCGFLRSRDPCFEIPVYEPGGQARLGVMRRLHAAGTIPKQVFLMIVHAKNCHSKHNKSQGGVWIASDFQTHAPLDASTTSLSIIMLVSQILFFFTLVTNLSTASQGRLYFRPASSRQVLIGSETILCQKRRKDRNPLANCTPLRIFVSPLLPENRNSQSAFESSDGFTF